MACSRIGYGQWCDGTAMDKIDLDEEGYPSHGRAAIQQQIVTVASRYRT
jgi:hypothetical protein